MQLIEMLMQQFEVGGKLVEINLNDVALLQSASSRRSIYREIFACEYDLAIESMACADCGVVARMLQDSRIASGQIRYRCVIPSIS